MFRLRLVVARLVVALGLLVSFPTAAHAAQSAVTYSEIRQQGIIFAHICTVAAPEDGGVDACECRGTGKCSLAEVTQIFVNIIVLILGLSGSVALLMFFYGGWNWVFAQGRPDYIQAGKDTMKHAVIGLAIIFGAYSIINLLIAILAGNDPAASLESTIEDLPAKAGDDDSGINAQDVFETAE